MWEREEADVFLGGGGWRLGGTESRAEANLNRGWEGPSGCLCARAVSTHLRDCDVHQVQHRRIDLESPRYFRGNRLQNVWIWGDVEESREWQRITGWCCFSTKKDKRGVGGRGGRVKADQFVKATSQHGLSALLLKFCGC